MATSGTVLGPCVACDLHAGQGGHDGSASCAWRLRFIRMTMAHRVEHFSCPVRPRAASSACLFACPFLMRCGKAGNRRAIPRKNWQRRRRNRQSPRCDSGKVAEVHSLILAKPSAEEGRQRPLLSHLGGLTALAIGDRVRRCYRKPPLRVPPVASNAPGAMNSRAVLSVLALERRSLLRQVWRRRVDRADRPVEH
jgi:hypothetical protein